MPPRDRAQLCVLATGAAFVVSLVRPPHPWEQQLQHLATPPALIGLFALARRGRLSAGAVGCACGFLLLHCVGARWLYSHVPGDERLTLFSLGGPDGRNHYDRLTHFASGLLLTPPVVEIAARYGGMKRAWAAAFAVATLLAVAAVYEVFEWSLTAVLNPAHADRYNGLQGDAWDAQKDMALAGLGAAVSVPWVFYRDAPPGRSRGSGSAS